jgi:hypothetical protein
MQSSGVTFAYDAENYLGSQRRLWPNAGEGDFQVVSGRAVLSDYFWFREKLLETNARWFTALIEAT